MRQASFGKPGESVELSFSLAEILVNLLRVEREGFIPFVRSAHYTDGGQNAALECLGANLGDVAATFLGAGNWRPHRKAIRECWAEKETNAKPSDGQSASAQRFAHPPLQVKGRR